MSSVPRAHAAGLPLRLLGLAQQNGGTQPIKQSELADFRTV